MSGGSWEYFYEKLDSVGMRLTNEHDPLRRAFGVHLIECAKAMRAIEWVDSCDCSPPHDIDAIRAAMGPGVDAILLSQAIKDGEGMVKVLQNAIAAAKKEERRGLDGGNRGAV